MRYLFPTGKGYQRKWLGQDVLSGVVIAAVSIPISMGYARSPGFRRYTVCTDHCCR